MSAVDDIRAALARVAKYEDHLQAFVSVREQALAEAEAVDARTDSPPFAGMPIAVKDIYDVAGLPTRCGSPATSDEPATESAACVQRLEELGAVVIGKSRTTEFAYFSPGPTTNPSAPGHTPGGSSSGSAAAVSAGVVPLAVGSQTAGSTTRPASFCGVAGFVFAQGTTDLRGQRPLAPSLDCLGLFTSSMPLLAEVATAYAGFEPAPAATRVLVWTPSGRDVVDPEMTAAVHDAVRGLNRRGIVAEPLEAARELEILANDHALVLAYEARRALAEVYETRRHLLSPVLAEMLDAGGRFGAADYERAMGRRAELRERFAHLLQPGTVVIGPAALGPPPLGLESTGSPALSRPWHQLGQPVVCVPGALTEDGLPLGIQLIGRPGSEGELLATGTLLESLLT